MCVCMWYKYCSGGKRGVVGIQNGGGGACWEGSIRHGKSLKCLKTYSCDMQIGVSFGLVYVLDK